MNLGKKGNRFLSKLFNKHRPMPIIVGSPRSGTSLLRLMLDAHPEIAVPPETGFLDIFGSFDRKSPALRDEFFEAVTNYPSAENSNGNNWKNWNNFKIPKEQFRQELAQIEPFTIAEGYRAFYRLYAARFGKKRWGEKTPLYCRSMAEIGKLLPEAHFIHLIRDGRDVALSLKPLPWSPGEEIEVRAEYWKTCVTTAKAQGKECRNFMELRYEDLLSDSTAALEKICRFINVRFHPDMLNYTEHAKERISEAVDPSSPDNIHAASEKWVNPLLLPPKIDQIQKWKTEMSADEQSRFEKIAGDLLLECGYESCGKK